MRSLIHTNPTTNEVRWCVANIIDMELTIEQYIAAVDLGFREDETHKPENFHWVLEPEGINMGTHEYKDGEFVLRPEPPARPSPTPRPQIQGAPLNLPPGFKLVPITEPTAEPTTQA